MKSIVFTKGMSETNDGIPRKSVPLYRWLMLISGLLFISLYAAISLGWLRPLSGTTTLARLEPFLFLFIGYYFGRSFSISDRTVLTEEIERQKRGADHEVAARQNADRANHFLTEKIKNANFVLGQIEFHSQIPSGSPEHAMENGDKSAKEISVRVARRILNS